MHEIHTKNADARLCLHEKHKKKKKKKKTKKNSLAFKQLSRKLEPLHANNSKTAPSTFKFWLRPW